MPRRKHDKTESCALGTLVPALVDAGVPLQSILNKVSAAENIQRFARKRLYAEALEENIHGTVMKEHVLTYNGFNIGIEAVDVRAHFQSLTSDCPHFARFLKRHLHDKGTNCLYMDGVTPGNALRPDCGRKYHAVYWTILELPEWWRLRSKNWFTFAYVSEKPLKDSGCPESVVLAWVFRNLYIKSEIHTLGLFYYCQGVKEHLILEHGSYLADGLAIYAAGSLKGGTARKPCFCLNCRGRADPSVFVGDPYYVHFKCSDYDRFVKCDCTTYNAMCDEIKQMHQTIPFNKTETEETERAYGIKYEAGGLAFDPEAREVARIPERVFFDWQHTCCSSGGVGQYHCNLFVMAIVDAGLATLEELDLFGASIKMPESQTGLSKSFFSDRIVWKHGAHFKGFAGDTLACVTVLGLYIDDYLDGKGILEDQVDAFKSLRRVLDLLKLGDKAVPRLRELRDEFKKYHALILALDGFHATVKTHYMRKIPDCIDLLKRLLSCWAPERKHRAGKMIAGHTYKGLTKSLLAHDLHNMKIEFSKPEAFQPIMLDCDNKLDGLQLFGSREVYGSRRVKTPIGTFAKNEILVWMEGGHLQAGFAEVFLRLAIPFETDDRFLCVVKRLRPLGGLRFLMQEVRPCFVPLLHIKAHAAYQEDGPSEFRLILSTAF